MHKIIGIKIILLPRKLIPMSALFAKYNRVYIIEDGVHTGYWNVEARDHQIELDT